MFKKKKERIYITELIKDPPISYPMYYTVSSTLIENEMLLDTLKAIHLCDFGMYKNPKNASEIFTSLNMGAFPIYKEQYAIGYFGGKLMYLDASGWKSVMVTEGIFDLTNWLI
jgi:hypothetical protein